MSERGMLKGVVGHPLTLRSDSYEGLLMYRGLIANRTDHRPKKNIENRVSAHKDLFWARWNRRPFLGPLTAEKGMNRNSLMEWGSGTFSIPTGGHSLFLG